MSAQDNLNDRQFYHSSYKRFPKGKILTGGHRLDDLYVSDQIHVAASYHPSGHVYQVDPWEDEPAPSKEHEYTTESARVIRKLPDREVIDAVQAHYNAPDEKALRDKRNKRL